MDLDPQLSLWCRRRSCRTHEPEHFGTHMSERQRRFSHAFCPSLPLSSSFPRKRPGPLPIKADAPAPLPRTAKASILVGSVPPSTPPAPLSPSPLLGVFGRSAFARCWGRDGEGRRREEGGGGGARGGDADPHRDTDPHRAAAGTGEGAGDAGEVLQEDGGGGGDVPGDRQGLLQPV